MSEAKEQNEVEEKEEIKAKEGKSNNKSIIAGIIVAILVIALVICGIVLYNKGILIVGNSIENMVGTYDLIEMTEGETAYSEDEIDALKKLGLNISLELREDKTGTLDLFGETMELNYDDKNMTVDGEKSPYTFDGGRISMKQAEYQLVFEKSINK